MDEERKLHVYEDEDGTPVLHANFTERPAPEKTWDRIRALRKSGFTPVFEKPEGLQQEEGQEGENSVPILDCLQLIAQDKPETWLKSKTVTELCRAKGWRSDAQRPESSVTRVMSDLDTSGSEWCHISTGSRKAKRYWLGPLPEEERQRAARYNAEVPEEDESESDDAVDASIAAESEPVQPAASRLEVLREQE